MDSSNACLLVAQLIFRGLPFDQAMGIAKALQLREHQRADFFALMRALLDMPDFPLKKEIGCYPITGEGVGELARRIILKSLQCHLPIESMVQSIRLAGQAMALGASPHSIVEALEHALDERVNGHALYLFISHQLGIDIPHDPHASACPTPVVERRGAKNPTRTFSRCGVRREQDCAAIAQAGGKASSWKTPR